MKILSLVACLVPALALAQNYPTPTFNSLTLQNPLTGTNGGTGVNNGSSTVTLGGNLTTSGANPLTLTTTGTTNVTLPTSGTILNSTTGATAGANSNITSLSGLTTPLSVPQGGTGATTSTGSGSVVLSTSPSLTTPALGVPSSVTLTNGTGLPISTGVSGLGSGVATGLSNAATGSGGPVLATSPTLASPTFTGSAAIAGGASNTNTLVVGNAANTSQGAQIQLIGNGATTPSKYLRAFGGTFAVLNNADNNILTLDDSGDATFNGNVTAPNFYGTVQGPTTGQFSIGSSLYPFVAQPVTTTANATNGSTSITVTSASGLAVGMGIYGSFVSSCSNNETIFSAAFVTAISGTTVTMSCPAVATASGASVQFGQPRWDSTSTLLANDIGAQTLKVGSAAQGNTASWLNQISAGQDYRLTSAAQIISPPGGGYGLTVAARTSDATGGAPAFPLQALFYADSGSPTNSEAAYFQSNLNSATAGKSLHIQFEQTIESAWGPPPGEDPYTINQTNQTIAHRLDCGSGGALTDNNCTSAIDIVPNAQAFESGIVFANGALDTGGGTRQGTVIGMPTMTGFTWYSGPSTYSAALWSPSAGVMRADVPTGGSYQFNINGSQVFGLKALLSSTTAPTISSGFGTGPTVYANNGTAAFGIHVGTSPGSSGILTMPTASNAWVCDGIDASQNNSTQFLLKQTASSTTSVTLGMFSSSGAAANFVAGDFLLVKCSAF